MTVATFSIPQKRSMWLLLLLISSTIAQLQYTSIYVPVGVGQSQKDRVLTEPFGGFEDKFNLCGKHTTDDLNPEFKKASVGSSIDYAIQCNPTPTRVIVSTDGKPFDFGRFPRDLKKECELFTCSADDYPKEGSDLGAITNQEAGWKVVATKPENPDLNVCLEKKAGYSTGATGNVLFANEDNCLVEHPALEATLMTPKKFVQLPRWIQKDQEKFNLKTMFYRGEMVDHLERVKYGVVKPVDTTKGAKYQTCNTACDSGQLVKLNMKPGTYNVMIYLNAKCPNFQICINPNGFLDDTRIPVCNPQLMINVMVHNGIVVFAKKGRASLIELKADNHQDVHPVAIEFGYGYKTESAILSEFYIGNDHREFVTSDTDGFRQEDADKLAFFFPTADCLVKTAGIFSKFITTGKAYTSEKVKVVGGVDDVQKGGQTITGPQNNSVTTTTLEPILDIAKTTTAAPLIVAPGAVVLEHLEDSIKSHATYVAGKWWVWGMYIGFIAGTLLTLLLGGGIFYLMRRTVFGIWYRGMYKRYGCDASGASGGITGVGYGNTVTGTQTVGATTAAGNTVIGDKNSGETGTVGSTEAATEATSTTSMLDKTNTLAM